MATVKRLRDALAKLVGESPTADNLLQRTVIRDRLYKAIRERASVVANVGALRATTPWRVGEWQEGEEYEYAPRIPIYDDMGEEIFNITAEDTADDAKSVKAIALAADIVKAVNMHDRLAAALKSAMPRHCVHYPGLCGKCARGKCPEYELLKEARGEK